MSDHSPEPHGRSSTRSMISVRIKPAERALIEQAAGMQGKSRTDFMLDASRRAAEETLLDQTLLRVDRATYDRFVELLDAPPRPNAQLRKLMQTKAPWD